MIEFQLPTEFMDEDFQFNFSNKIVSQSSYLFSYPCKRNDECGPITLKLSKGYYLFECWGSSSFLTSEGFCGKGAYTSGILKLDEEVREFYVYIGSYAIEQWEKSYNGGGFDQISGGGATDVRLKDGDWDNFESLKSRIMVAGGGGGWDGTTPGNAVGIGSNTLNYTELGGNANQTEGGKGFASGYFGHGGGKDEVLSDGCGGGGGGYYGGGSSPSKSWGSGGGGSSYVSGYPNCDSISNESPSIDNITHTHQPVHYSGFRFLRPRIIDGSSKMPSHDPLNPNEMIGNIGNGAFKITHLSSLSLFYCRTCRCLKRSRYLCYIVLFHSVTSR